MDTIELLGSAMGLGLLAGIRLYATVFCLGLAIRVGWFQLSPSLSELSVVAEMPVLILSGIACAAEFLADKIPWFDSLWDSVHTFIRPVGAAALGVTALGTFDPATKFMIALLCGGVAFTGHTAKSATRLAVNHSPEPFSNWALSLGEDLFIPAGLWISFQHPAISIVIASIFIAVFLWLSPKIFRLLHVSWVALRSLISRWFGTAPVLVGPRIPPDSLFSTDVLETMADLPFQRLPDREARKLRAKLNAGGIRSGIHCAATRSVRGLNNSTGYLCILPDQFVFIAKRMFRMRTVAIGTNDIRAIRRKSGVFVDRLFVETDHQELAFDVFKL